MCFVAQLVVLTQSGTTSNSIARSENAGVWGRRKERSDDQSPHRLPIMRLNRGVFRCRTRRSHPIWNDEFRNFLETKCGGLGAAEGAQRRPEPPSITNHEAEQRCISLQNSSFSPALER